MNYELAKKLKDAGFPNSRAWLDNGAGYWVDKGEFVYEVPTFSELIEACGDCLSHIKKYNGNWWAVSHCGHKEHETDGNNIEEAAPTPEEAVARLWLALNRKEV